MEKIKSQSPQIGSLFQSEDTVEETVEDIGLNPLKSGHCFNLVKNLKAKDLLWLRSQSPQIGSLFQWIMKPKMIGIGMNSLNPLKSGHCFNKPEQEIWFIFYKSLNPLKSGHCFNR